MSSTMDPLNISEIFYAPQGEGANVGTPMIFIRLQGCKAKHACYASGIKCDTEFESGSTWEVHNILSYIMEHFPQASKILWTGGEPMDQLTKEHTDYFDDFWQGVESSGLYPIPENMFDYITISPKVAEHVLQKNFGVQVVDELRYVRHAGQQLPAPVMSARHYFISPHSDGYQINQKNLNHCISLILDSPEWRLSVQQHKIWNTL